MNHYGIEDCPGPLFAPPTQAPAQQHSRTSMQAADSLDEPTLNAMQRSVVAFLKARGEHGATDEEMQLGIPMDQNTQRPRRVELVRRGFVVEAGTRKTKSGRYATAWRLA